MTKAARIYCIDSINQSYDARHAPRVDNRHAWSTRRIILSIVTLRFVFYGLIQLYKLAISPLLPHSCIFVPSCSTYMMTAIQKHGALSGIPRGILRLLRCNPFNRGGVDPVPDSQGDKKWLL